jgi:hypothetical protein
VRSEEGRVEWACLARGAGLAGPGPRASPWAASSFLFLSSFLIRFLFLFSPSLTLVYMYIVQGGSTRSTLWGLLD